MFTNAVHLYADMNPDFFKGTAVESEAGEGVEWRLGVDPDLDSRLLSNGGHVGQEEQRMVTTKGSRSQQIRSKLPHPIVDADGHMLELTPVLSDYVNQVGGADARDLFDRTMVGAAETGNAATIGGKTWFEMDLEEKKEAWFSAPPWWAMPTRSALDRATATVPRVLNDRMDELGMDYAVLYTTTAWRLT